MELGGLDGGQHRIGLLLHIAIERVRQTGPELLHEGRELLYVAHAGGELLVDGRRQLAVDVQLHLLVDPERSTTKYRQVSGTRQPGSLKMEEAFCCY